MMFFSSMSSPGVPLAWSSVWTTLSRLALSSAGTEYLRGERDSVSGPWPREGFPPVRLKKNGNRAPRRLSSKGCDWSAH